MKLRDVPPQLAQALPGYAKDQYFIVDNQFVVVEKQTRRIVAILPTPTVKESRDERHRTAHPRESETLWGETPAGKCGQETESPPNSL